MFAKRDGPSQPQSRKWSVLLTPHFFGFIVTLLDPSHSQTVHLSQKDSSIWVSTKPYINTPSLIFHEEPYFSSVNLVSSQKRYCRISCLHAYVAQTLFLSSFLSFLSVPHQHFALQPCFLHTLRYSLQCSFRLPCRVMTFISAAPWPAGASVAVK